MDRTKLRTAADVAYNAGAPEEDIRKANLIIPGRPGSGVEMVEARFKLFLRSGL